MAKAGLERLHKKYARLADGWDLSRPILMKKQMQALINKRVMTVHMALTLTPPWVPDSMQRAGISRMI
eukprot:CAMPEP_0185904298 /NCGR_PEP_ID=MMETSP0196C-20130402/3616_1 /TAXON_ID=2932 /ORGANISM="Alexandrium fundyense, Strain CCMP1719" /LENGTH=67 /DNA_ID=CAMNT_0028623575 /DNA_START=66 /DNA_END=266 /DNA_ORIENTATION=-